MGETRVLTSGEQEMLSSIFGSSLDYSRVTVRDGGTRDGSGYTPFNRINIGSDIYSSDYSLEENVHLRGFFIHESSHAMQSQNGPASFFRGIGPQIVSILGGREGIYDYTDKLSSGVPFEDWNIEEQASYFEDLYKQRVETANGAPLGSIPNLETLQALDTSTYPGLSTVSGTGTTREECFGPEASISMWPLDPEFAPDPNNPFKQYDQDAVRAKIWKKPIEQIRVGDYVVSHDKDGNMVPGYVPRTMGNDAKVLLNFHGTPVTPGHVYYRPDSKNSYKYETLIDVLRDDGMIEHSDVVKLRAATNVPVGTPRDGFVQAVTGTLRADGGIDVKERGRIRLGTRFLVGEGKERKSFAVADLIEHGGGVVGEDELIRVGDGPGMPFHWNFGETLPKPEDFVLACSSTTLEEIYQAGDWESQGPRLSAPMVLDRGPVQPLKGAALSAMPRNEPLDVAHSPMASAKPQRKLPRTALVS